MVDMGMLEIEFVPDLQEWVDHRLNEGLYVDASEYLRDFIRRDMWANTNFEIDPNTQTEGL
jgi:Arc/MetJ-type ribon-helix-helix transcriptional regulator